MILSSRATQRSTNEGALDTFLSVMRARYPSLLVRSDSDVALRHGLASACEQKSLE